MARGVGVEVTSCLYCGKRELAPVSKRSDGVGILRCAHCSLMMVDHLAADTAGMYGLDYFEKPAETGYGYTSYLSLPAANVMGKYAFARLFAADENHHLDLGSANGALMELFTAAGFTSQGLEISEAAAGIARQKGLDVVVSNLHGFPKAIAGSNVITAFDLLEHADKPGEVLRAVRSNLRNDGVFVFSTLAVTTTNPKEYWFNHSLEHYAYYDERSLRFILEEVFGPRNYDFVAINNGGVVEFWGVARKAALSRADTQLLQRIAADVQSGPGSSTKLAAGQAYYLSLFYNQVGKPKRSRQLIKAYGSGWTPVQQAEAAFYRLYFQGKFERALRMVMSVDFVMPAGRSGFWQAVAYAAEAYSGMRQRDVAGEYDQEIVRLKQSATAKSEDSEAERKQLHDQILDLRSELFKVRDELHGLKNSRVVGRIIKARNIAGDSARRAIPAAKSAPRKGLYKTRKAVAKVLPPPLSRGIMRVLRGVKRRVENRPAKPIQYISVRNEVWPARTPLVSVVIPYYNRADTIDETLQSLDRQTYRSFETIIVDDGSTDPESVDKLTAIAAEQPRVKIMHQKNQGVAIARNHGIAASKGKYVICLDSDDLLDDTFIEKAILVLETTPDVALITSYQDMFGVVREMFRKSPYDPLHLYEDNMVITAAAFRREAWQASGGYKPRIGYEDWEFWLSLAEHGFWGKLIPEPLFKYRTSLQSRYVDDKDVHWNNMKVIRNLHPRYKSTVRALQAQRAYKKHVVDVQSALVNAGSVKDFAPAPNDNKRVLIAIPWMTFGGAETLIYNFCRELKKDFNVSFVTGLQSEHEWEYKFREISTEMYHLSNLFEDAALYLEFMSHYIETRRIDLLHIIHNGFVFDMLPELKKRHPQLKVIVTVFNDVAPYCEQSIGFEQYVDVYSADNQAVTNKYAERLTPGKAIRRIPNGINTSDEFNPDLFDRLAKRAELGIADDEVAVFFVGRLSEEKNPDVFLEAANMMVNGKASTKTRFFMIGDGPMRPQIDEQLKKIHSPRVTYLGYQSKVAQFLPAADVFVLPSSAEGFPMAILEAMAMQTAPVASRVGGVPDIIDDGHDGFIVTPGSAQEIAQAISKLEADPKLLHTMKLRARDKIDFMYSNRILGANYRKMYRDTLK